MGGKDQNNKTIYLNVLKIKQNRETRQHFLNFHVYDKQSAELT